VLWPLEMELPLSPRGEHVNTDTMSLVAARRQFHVVEAGLGLPIGDEAAEQ
jgi:hypothetical protein